MDRRLDEETRALAGDPANIKLARSIARRYRRAKHHDVDIIESAALAGLCEAAARYRPEEGIPFQKFAAIRINGAILDELRRMFGRSGRKASFVRYWSSFSAEELKAITSREMAAPMTPVGGEMEAKEFVRTMISPLKGKHHQVMNRLYLGKPGARQREVAKSLKISEQYVTALHRQAIASIRQDVERATQD